MKTKHIIWIASLFIALVIALVVAIFNQPVVSAQNLGTASIFMQITPTPLAEECIRDRLNRWHLYYGGCHCIDRDRACSGLQKKMK